jgi:hypothetical protein
MVTFKYLFRLIESSVSTAVSGSGIGIGWRRGDLDGAAMARGGSVGIALAWR